MRNILYLFIIGSLLSGCYSQSLTMVGPAAGVYQGNTTQTLVSTSVNQAVKQRTGKSAMEHVLTKKQIEQVESQKQRLNPCDQNPLICTAIKNRINKTRKILSLN